MKVAGDNGKDLDRDVKFGFLRCAYASDNKAEIDAYLDCARFQRRISESLKFRRAQSDDGYMIKEVPSATDPTMEQLRKNLPVGSVNQVIDKMLEEISILRPKHIALQTQLGDFDQKTMLKQIELWGERIIPAIRKEVKRWRWPPDGRRLKHPPNNEHQETSCAFILPAPATSRCGNPPTSGGWLDVLVDAQSEDQLTRSIARIGRRADEGHVWIAPAVLRFLSFHHAGEALWEAGFARMLAYAEKAGWVDEQERWGRTSRRTRRRRSSRWTSSGLRCGRCRRGSA